MEVLVAADKAAYVPGEPITLTLRVVNGTDRPVSFTFRSAQRFDFIVRDYEGLEVWRWGASRMFAQELGSETIPPSSTLAYTAEVGAKLSPGLYTGTGVFPAEEGSLTASVVVRVERR